MCHSLPTLKKSNGGLGFGTRGRFAALVLASSLALAMPSRCRSSSISRLNCAMAAIASVGRNSPDEGEEVKARPALIFLLLANTVCRMFGGTRVRASIAMSLFLLSAAAPDASELPPANLNPVVLSETPTAILFLHPIVGADCATLGDVNIKVIKQPKNGSLELIDRMGHTTFAKDNQRYKCNLSLVPGTWLEYSSKAGFKGSDEAEIQAFWERGVARKYRFRISVR